MNNKQEVEIGPWLALFHLSLPLKLSLQLINHFGSPAAVLAAAKADLDALGAAAAAEKIGAYQDRPQSGEIVDKVEESLTWAQQDGNHLISLADSRYPLRLKETISPPLLLFVRGHPEILADPQVAIVGSRHAGPVGIDTAQRFARELSACGLTVTSGLALGVDAAAHRGAVAADSPTLAVMATGADRIYPRRHEKLASQIIAQGALVTEFPLGTVPRPACFPQRNRIISGLSLGVLVVEAALRSGSLITARRALEQNREVFAIPGSIHSPTSRGCHALIRQGAKLVESVQDILEEIAPQLMVKHPARSRATVSAWNGGKMAPGHQRVLALIGFEPTPMDQLVERSGLAVAEISRTLMQLELEQQIKNVPGGFIRYPPGRVSDT